MSRDRTSYYPTLAFHSIRFVSLLSSALVTGLLAYFLLHLKSNGFRLPWVLLILLIVGIFTLLYLLLTWSIHSCGTLKPLFSLLLNIPLIVLWVVGFSLLTYNIYGTLGHSCSKGNWGNSSGVTVCNIYKLFYSFVLFALLSQIALAVLDLRARAEQKRSGIYNRMSEENKSLKLDSLNPVTRHTPETEVPYGVDPDGGERVGLRTEDTAYQPHNAPVTYPSTDNFYQQRPYSHRNRGYSNRSNHSVYGGDSYDRPGMYSRGESHFQSSRSDVPMLQDYNYYGQHQNTAYGSGRQISPRRY